MIPPSSTSSSSGSAATCPRCHQPIPAGAAHGLCPACLLAAGFFTQPAADPSSAPPPTLEELAPEFPQLELLELLGRGGMGAVYKARQRHLDRLVALKLLRPGLDADPSFAERFTREARALAQLNHPGIVTLHEFGRTPGGLYFIVMEFVDGVNLRQLLAAGRLAPREALAIVPPLCDALQYAHDRGLVHRDIKPENILADRLGRVKIADFGLAKLAACGTSPDADSDGSSVRHSEFVIGPSSEGGLTEAGKVMGTPRYMAPEQRERPAEVDHRADIYALGVVLYQMLTGELPDEKQLQPPSQRVRLDVRLDEIVLRALEQNPDLRYAAASELKTRIETVAATPATEIPAPSTGPTAKSVPDRPLPDQSPRFSGPALAGLLWAATVPPACLLYFPALRSGRAPNGAISLLLLPLLLAAATAPVGTTVLGWLAVGRIRASKGVQRGLGLAVTDGVLFPLLALFAGIAFLLQSFGVGFLGWSRNYDPQAESRLIFLTCIIWSLASGLLLRAVWRAVNSAKPTVPETAAERPGRPLPIPSQAFATLPWLGFAALYLLFAALLALTAGSLPDRVASHFDGDGRADGWMSRDSYLIFAGLVPLGLGAAFALIARLLKVLPARWINLPHREHWLAPQRRNATATLLSRWLAAPACLVVIFCAALHILLIPANLVVPPHLPGGPMLGLTIGFLAALMVWLVGFVLRFAEPAVSPRKLRLQNWTLGVAAALALLLPAAPLIDEWHDLPGKLRRMLADPEPTPAENVSAPRSPNFTGHLPGGGYVELMGVAAQPSTKIGWWAPDGTPLAPVAWHAEYPASWPIASKTEIFPAGRQFVLHADGPGQPPSVLQFQFLGSDGKPTAFSAGLVTAGPDNDTARWAGALMPLRQSETSASLRILIADGELQRLPASEVILNGSSGGTLHAQVAGRKVIVGKIYARHGKATVDISYELGGETEWRLRARDSNNRWHTARTVGGGSSGWLAQETRVFDGLRLSDVVELALWTRPAHWVEFAGVSLVANQSSQVSVTVENPTRAPSVGRAVPTLLTTEQLMEGRPLLADAPADALRALAADLQRRLGNDFASNEGRPGPDHAYLSLWIASIGAELGRRPAAAPANSPTPADSPAILAEVRFIDLPRGFSFDPATFDPTQAARATGVSLLSAPRITVRSGQECEIAVSRERSPVPGPEAKAYAPAPSGVTVQLRPTLNGRSVAFTARFTLAVSDSAERTTSRELVANRECPLDSPLTLDFGLDAQGRRQVAVLGFSLPPAAP